MREFNEQSITQAVIDRLSQSDDPRFKQVMTSLVTHLHDFVRDVKLTEEDLASEAVQVRFTCIDDRGFIFVNNQRMGESTDWSAEPAFDIKRALHVGDNVIAVGLRNESNMGGLNPDVNVELMGKPLPTPWSRSLFNGLAQVIVQSSSDAGEIKLTASADGLQSGTATVTTVAGGMRPSVP